MKLKLFFACSCFVAIVFNSFNPVNGKSVGSDYKEKIKEAFALKNAGKLSLAEKAFSDLLESYCHTSREKNDYRDIVTGLIKVNLLQRKYNIVEELYETHGRKLWSPSQVDFEVGSLLALQGRYDEAKAVISNSKDSWLTDYQNMKKTNNNVKVCATNRFSISEKINLINRIQKNSYASSAKIAKISEERKKRFHQYN